MRLRACASASLLLVLLAPGWVRADGEGTDAPPLPEPPVEVEVEVPAPELDAPVETDPVPELDTPEEADLVPELDPPEAAVLATDPAAAALAGIAVGNEEVVSESPPAPPPPSRPYSIPWLLRPLPAIDVFRLDQSVGIHDAYGPTDTGITTSFVQVLTLSVRVEEGIALVMRQGWALTGSATANFSAFLLGMNLSYLLDPRVRLSVFLATTIPQGGLNTDPSNRDARFTRLAYENALWLPNYLAGIAGLGVGFIDGGWTVQAEATLFVLGALYGPVDEAIVNATFGAQVGYFLRPEFSLSGEVHHQHFLSSPGALRRLPPVDYGSEHQSQTSVSLGIRLHFHLEGRTWMRPGISYGVGFDAPLAGDAWQVIQFDIPILY